MKLLSLALLAALLLVLTPAASAQPSYVFDRTISEPVLRNYLARSITMADLITHENELPDNIRMLKFIGARFAGRTVYCWGHESSFPSKLNQAHRVIPRIHAAIPDLVLQACVFEIVTREVQTLTVPESTFTAFGLPAEKRNFRYDDMLFPNGRFHDHWGPGSSVPDISRLETRLLFYTLATGYIDTGIEALHMGQVDLMNAGHRDCSDWADLLKRIRAYAATHARRHMVLIDGHVPSGGLLLDGRLLLDFHSFPMRTKEVSDKPQEAVLEKGFSDSIYGRSKGGIAPSGWKCDHLPTLVEFDNYGRSRTPGKPRSGGIWTWGYDEITWFAMQPEPYRNQFLRYALKRVHELDPDCYLEMPGSRMLSPGTPDKPRWYWANSPSPALPGGFAQEDTIRRLWSEEPAP